MLRIHFLWRTLLCFLIFGDISQHADAAQHALLIGCSDYKTQTDLHGCGNDVKLLRTQLKSPRFGFTDANLTVLSDADSSTPRPTYQNICAAFDTIVKAEWAVDAEPDVLFIYLSGHGGQRVSETEPDGTDEFFMPIDETDVILDDQIGEWLEQLTTQNIHVWIVFDSCFSGTMTRGTHPDETVRGVPPTGIKPATSNEHVGWELPPVRVDKKGSCIAFYACQAFERAIEDKSLDTSLGEPIPHGLFTYCLSQCLAQQSNGDNKLTYEDLRRRIIDQYRKLGRTWPTPFCEGSLDQEVLGLATWPKSTPLFLTKEDNQIRMEGGLLSGVTLNAIAAVFAPEDREQTTPLGYVKIDQVSATESQIHSAAFADLSKPVPLDQFPEHASCRIVSQELGELRIPLTFTMENSIPSDTQAAIQKVFTEKAASPLSVFQISNELPTQGWSLRLNADEQWMLLPNAVVLTTSDMSEHAVEKLRRLPHVKYDDNISPNELATLVEEDLRKIYNFKNLERLAVAYGEQSLDLHEIKLDMQKISGDMTTSEIKAGDKLRFKIINESPRECAYAIFFATGRYRIKQEKTGFVKPAPSLFTPTEYHLFDVTINDKMIGNNSVILVAIPQQGKVKHQLNYSGLNQSSLGVLTDQKRGFTPSTSFERQLYEATFGNQKFRTGGSDDQPQMSMVSWVISPTERASSPNR